MLFFYKKLVMRTNVLYNFYGRKVIGMKGRVKWWSNEKGYGFIEYSNDSHIFAYLDEKEQNNLYFLEGEQIEFDIEQTDKGKFIRNLKKLNN